MGSEMCIRDRSLNKLINIRIFAFSFSYSAARIPPHPPIYADFLPSTQNFYHRRSTKAPFWPLLGALFSTPFFGALPGSNFYRFLADFGTQKGAKINQNRPKIDSGRENGDFSKNTTSPMRNQRFSLPKASKIHQNLF